MADIDAWLSHAVTAVAAGMPGIGAWWLEWRKNRVTERHEAVADRRSAVDELGDVVHLLQKQVDRMQQEIDALRVRAETAEGSLRQALDENRTARHEIHALRNWMQTKGLALPPEYVLPAGAAHA